MICSSIEGISRTCKISYGASTIEDGHVPVSGFLTGELSAFGSTGVDIVSSVAVSPLSISIDWARFVSVGCVIASGDSADSDIGTEIMSTSSCWLEGTSASSSDAGLFSGDEDLCGISSAPPIIDRCRIVRNGECPRVS